MQSAPAAIPATIEVTLPAGLAAVDATGAAVIAILLEISSDRPTHSAAPVTGSLAPSGESGSFSVPPKATFAFQHHPRYEKPTVIRLFDNGNKIFARPGSSGCASTRPPGPPRSCAA
ncbi:hypothetical protein GCM10023317_06010 [Actinopolymorpha pittospori]|uniref:Uncharacterized protein n=1 Tax=Actinopolymorpha pittospori TaxID=648752 RepID=A0A927R6U7_9ACTN|nr:hypothetical protein [Actinopolymorpha pittospori]